MRSYARASEASKRWKDRKKTLRMAVKRGILTEGERRIVQEREQSDFGVGGPCGESCKRANNPICRCVCGGANHGTPLPEGMSANQWLHARRMGRL